MSFVLGEWREGKVCPVPGNAPHGRPVSRVIPHPFWNTCDDSCDTTRFPQLLNTGPWYAFSRHGGIFHTDEV